MVIKCKFSTKVNGKYEPAGSLVDIEDKKEALDLVSGGYAELPDGISPMSNTEDALSNRELIDSLCHINGVNVELAKALIDKGLCYVEEVACAEAETLVEIPGIGEKSAEKIIESAIELNSEE